MATTKRPSYPSVMTGRGVLVFPKITAPDTKFKAEGEFQAKIRLSAEDSATLIAKIDKTLQDYWPIAKAELEEKLANAKTGAQKAQAKKALEEMKEADKSYRPAYDDDGEETGEIEFNFKSPAYWVKDKGKATEKKVPIKIDLFDAKGKPIKSMAEPWTGTIAIVAGELRPFNMPIGVGVSLRLKAVQILELSNGSGSKTAAGYGFGAEEGGFEATDEDDSGTSSDDDGDSDGSDSGEGPQLSGDF